MNKFVNWKYEWSLGVELIDQQHRDLAVVFNRIGELYLSNDSSLNFDQRSSQLQEQLNMFYVMVKEHFNGEDALMLEVNYPGYNEHAREHLMLLAELRNYIRQVEEELDNINIGILSSLKSWFISHIVGSDKEFSVFFQAYSKRTSPLEYIMNL